MSHFRCGKPFLSQSWASFTFIYPFPRFFFQEEIKDSRDLGEVFILYAAVIINLIPFATYLSHQETFIHKLPSG